ncbi:MAG: TIGR03960 family B12-binding radical SAM protein [Desulfobacteraceae bacterium]|nr:MAG: TIGR03960 family B12-binding radical SAM protein [Desulfobacteraceae bacterium]
MARKSIHSRQRYIDSEIGTVFRKRKGKTEVALIYPNTYSVGMSNLGFQTVYRLLNEMDMVSCERAFLPDSDETADSGIRTMESNRSIHEFPVIAFSVSFESDFLNLIAVVEKAGLPLQSAARGDPHPLVIAGGVACFLNPEPAAPFVDCFLIGEAEQLLPRFIEALDLSAGRKENLYHIARTVPGAYVPQFYTPVYHSDRTIKEFAALEEGVPKTIKRVFEKELSATSAYTSILTPNTAFRDTFLVEVSRGCPHGCRFCTAGFIYRPPRFRSAEVLKQNIDMGKEMSRKIGLMGTAVSDHPEIGALCQYAIDRDLSVSFSSLRADALTPELMEALKKSGIKTATIAPEAGSERMRRIINKGLTETQIVTASKTLVKSGIPNLKLYFMIGLPWETDADIDAIVTLCIKIKEQFLEASREEKHIGTITVSVNPFVPKPFTPFQWVPMDDIKQLNRKIKKIRDGLGKVANVNVQAESPRKAIIQALLSRGDRRVSDILLLALKNQGNWSRTIKESDQDISFYVNRERSTDEFLPWDFLDHGIRKSFLRREYERARRAETSKACPMKSCDRCGVCQK